jgi:hypothetical protein
MTEGKQQQVFKNVANLALRGTTFDAHHLDKFLGSPFGEKSFSIDRALNSKSTLVP